MKDFLTFLTDPEGRCYIVQNGTVRKTARLAALPYNPGGLTEIAIGWERKLTDLGITRNFSAPLQYHQEAATILKDFAYNRDIEEKLFLLLHKRELYYDTTQTPARWHWHYASYYKGEIDTTTIKHADITVTASIAEGGILTKYTANKGTAYEFALDDPDAILVNTDGINLSKTQHFLIPEWVNNSNLDTGRHLIGIYPTTADGDSFGLAFFDVNDDIHEPTDPTSDDRYFIRAGQAVAGIRLKGRITIQTVLSSGEHYQAFLVRSGGATIQLVSVTNLNAPQQYDFDFDVTFDMVADERMFLYGEYGHAIVSGVIYRETQVDLSFKSRLAHTYTKAFRPATLQKRLAGKVLGDESLAASTLLASNVWPCLTSGDAIRGITGAVLKTTLDQFHTFTRVVTTGMPGIEGGQLIVEAPDHYLDPTATVSIGAARNLVVTEAKEELVNTVRIGYEPQDMDDVNGRYAFNFTQTYTSVVTRISKEYALVCPYVADPYAIELQRIKGNTSTDSQTDNKVVLLDVDLDNPQTDPVVGTYYNLRRPTGTIITGIPDPDSIYNVGLSPKRLMARHARWIDSLFYGFGGKKLTFTTTDRNRDLKTVTGSVVVEEQADYVIGRNPLFIPKVFDFDTEVPTNLVEVMAANPNRCFSFTWYGYPYTGFPLKVGIAPVDNKAQAFKLLCAPTSNLKNLIAHG